MSGSSAAERQAALPLPPMQSTTPGLGITRLATSTTAASHALAAYSHLFHKRLTLANEGTDAIWIAFAPTAGTTLVKGTAAGATIAAGTVAANGFKLAGGAIGEVCLNATDHAHLWVQAEANTPTLCIYPSSHPHKARP
jgi:hypothetical protein